MRRSAILLTGGLLAVLLTGLPCRAVKPDASAAAAAYEQGLKHARQGQDEQAAADFQRAIQFNPERFVYTKALDDLLARRGQWDAIIAAWTRFIELEPDNAQAYRERGGAYSQKHDLVHAFADAEKACSLGDQRCCRIAAGLRQALPPPAPQASPPPPYSPFKKGIARFMVLIGFAVVVFLLIYIGRKRKKAEQAAGPDAAARPQLPYGWGKFGGLLSIALGATSEIAALVMLFHIGPSKVFHSDAYGEFGFLILAGLFLFLMGHGLLRKRMYGLLLFILAAVLMLINIVSLFIVYSVGPEEKIGGSFFVLVLVICLAYFARRMRGFR